MTRTALLLLVTAAAVAVLAGCGSTCGPSSCSGCCDPSGVCQSQTDQACGKSGVACQACIGGQQCQVTLGECVFPGGNGTGTTGTTATASSGSSGTPTGTTAHGPSTGTNGASASTGTNGASSSTGTTGASSSTGTTGASSNTGTSGSVYTSCTQASDCPSTEKTCAPLAGQPGSICQCATDALCGAGFACNNIDRQCQQICTVDANCQGFSPPRTCDTATGQCSYAPQAPCRADGGAACPSGQTCDPATGQCVVPASCGTNQTQGNCPYGQACFTPAAGGTATQCEQIAQCSTAFNTTIVPGQSPVVFDVALGSTRADSSGTCGTGTVQKFTGHLYDPANSLTAASTDRYNEIFYVRSASVPGGGVTGNTFQNTAIDPIAGTFTFELCTDLNQLAKGVYLQGLSGQPSDVACIPAF
jgi:hypothetical protein